MTNMRTFRLLLLALLMFVAFAVLFTCYGYGEDVTCEGWSMCPTLPFKSKHFLNRFYPYGSLQPGMVVARHGVIDAPGVDICHRLVRFQHRDWLHRSAGWVTKGDGNSRPDMGLMTEKNYLGVVPIAP